MKLWPHLKLPDHLNPLWVHTFLEIVRILTTLDVKTKDSFAQFCIFQSFPPN